MPIFSSHRSIPDRNRYRHKTDLADWEIRIMEEPTWTVVKFIEDDSVEVVPTGWIEGDKCYWPLITQNKLRNAIKKSERRNASWAQHPVKMLRNGTFNDYVKARAKAKAMMDIGNQESEMEAGCSKRKMQPLSLLSSGDSSDEEILDTPPSIKKRRTSVIERPIDPKIMLTHGDEESLQGNRNAEENENQQQQCSSEKQDEVYCCKGCCRRDEHMKIIIQQNLAIQTLLTDVLQQLESKKDIHTRVPTHLRTPPFFQRFWGLQFPLNTEEHLAEFLELLDSNDNFYDGVEEVYKIGGSSCYEFVRRTLATLLTDELALSYSWLGRKGKKPFKHTNMARLIICAAEKAKTSKSHKETETAIQLWLKRATDRIKRVTNKF